MTIASVQIYSMKNFEHDVVLNWLHLLESSTVSEGYWSPVRPSRSKLERENEED